MAKKSKTQRAKASAARQERKAQRDAAELQAIEQGATAAEARAQVKEAAQKERDAKAAAKAAQAKEIEKASKKKPGRITTFFKEVRAEMKRVTWPTRQDVLRWSGVVVAALLFFGIYVAVLDNAIVTPILLFISSLGA